MVGNSHQDVLEFEHELLVVNFARLGKIGQPWICKPELK